MTDQTNKVIRVGVMGFSSKPFDRDLANRYLEDAFDKIAKIFPDREIVIVSGLTFIGIPALAYAHATIRGWQTEGIACKKAHDYPKFPCNTVIIIGDEWGEESEEFTSSCHVYVRVGGGPQSFREIEAARKRNVSILEYDLDQLPA
ncbi:hypothetical protein A2572_04720 [Candidatus Collierbacteria bacterium RIFOXYD1_FULL_40_9]|uniref:Uncharacterized protein n=1 Tax=Candidatus Collierbacteria bacterium RIFOXYD1_FULL_40_9 TaxID=1817731 RepID=A0A1F5FT88_9BACT|nr:MAG: hypothetical protein A2572_04720 [Candidatus Collierbacteria bacterium RIFOXYD1_FULL_40_9]